MKLKRKLIQIAAFGFSNFRVANLFHGKIYKGSWKNFCNPGMNCYSCPAANLSCPIGALQAVGGSPKFGISFYVLGFILALGVVLGRAVCAFLCPFGLIQELLFRISTKKYRLPRFLTYVKYVILVVFVLILPAFFTNPFGMGKPAFCEFICPVGTLEGGIPLLLTNTGLRESLGILFFWKAFLLAVTLLGCIFVHRFFCKVLCPLGAIYGLLNKVSFLKLSVNKEKCTNCGLCAKKCLMDVNPVENPQSLECIRCGECVKHCPNGAICLGFGNKRMDKEE